jgi:4-amino-4-deoxy-L-arabinose transferase-like glycosyltransferase
MTLWPGRGAPHHPWMLVALSLILAHTGWQTWHIASSPYPARYDYDEGVYAETAAAAAVGVRLYAGVFLSQPPLLPLALAEAYRVAGPSLAAARDTIVAFSLFWLLSIFAIPAGGGRPRAGALAVLALVGSPVFLTATHTVQMEAPSEALAAAAVALAVLGLRRPGMLWWAAAGATWGLAVMTKLTAAVSIAPLVVAAVVGPDHRGPVLPWTGRMGALAVGAVGAIAPFLPVRNLTPFVAQVLLFHLSVARHLGPDPVGRLRLAMGFLATGFPLLIAAGFGVRLALRGRGPVERMLVAWLGAALAASLALRPLWPHHLAILLSPLALLAGGALDRLVERATGAARGAVACAAVAGVAAYCLAGVVVSGLPASSADLREVSARIVEVLPPTGAILTDDPLVAFLAQRPVPPEFIDTSIARLRAGQLSRPRLDAALRDGRIGAVLFWRGTFAQEFPGLASEAAVLFPIRAMSRAGRVLRVRISAAQE